MNDEAITHLYLYLYLEHMIVWTFLAAPSLSNGNEIDHIWGHETNMYGELFNGGLPQ